MIKKLFCACIYLYQGSAVRNLQDHTVVDNDAARLAAYYCNNNADRIIVFDQSNTDEEHELALDTIKKIAIACEVPVIGAGNVKRMEDVKKLLYAGVKRAMLNFSKKVSIDLIKEVSLRFGKEKIAVSLNDFDTLFKQQHLIEQYSSEIVFMHRLDLNSVVNVTEIPCVVVTDTMDESEILRILKSNGVKGVSGMFISSVDMDFNDFKEVCMRAGIKMTSFESMMDFSEFKLNSDGLIPVIVQDYKTNEVLMMAYMNEEAFDHTVKTGRMTYYSRSRNAQWVKGETSGHFQYVKSLSVDCDKDTLLAKVDQVGAACHTGNRSCFYTTIVGTDYDAKNPLQVFESVYNTIVDRKQNPKEGSYTNYLFEKGIDKILKKVGEEATEIVIAAKNPDPEEVKYEISDFLYHAMVLMVEKGVTWEEITNELARR